MGLKIYKKINFFENTAEPWFSSENRSDTNSTAKKSSEKRALVLHNEHALASLEVERKTVIEERPTSIG